MKPFFKSVLLFLNFICLLENFYNSFLFYIFRDDIEANALGSPPCMDLLVRHRPSYWFSAHLHCKFAALVPKDDGSPEVTKFLALDKCLPKRKFLQILEIPHDEKSPIRISYDLEWLTILYLTNHLLSVKSGTHYMPGKGGDARSEYTPTEAEKNNVSKQFGNDFVIPENFVQTSKPYNPESPRGPIEPARMCINPQTTRFCDKLGIDDPSALLRIMTNTKDNSFSNCAADKSSDSRNTSLTFEDDNVLSSTLDEDSPDESSYRTSPSSIAPESSTVDCSITEKSDDFSTSADDKETDDKITELTATKAAGEKDCETVGPEPNCKKFKRRNHSFYNDTA